MRRRTAFHGFPGIWVLALAALAALPGAAPSPAAPAAPVLQDDTPVLERPWPATSGKFHFAILGDRRGGNDSEWPVFDRAVQEINRLRPDFVIMVGDLIEGNSMRMEDVAAEWTDFFSHARLDAPFFYLPGNHDVSNPDMLRWWKEHLGRTYYSFDYRGSHFLVLNSQEHWEEGASSLGAEQIEFALQDLEAHRDAAHTFIFLHVPLWRGGGTPEWNAIEAALGDRPCTMFAGHEHRLQTGASPAETPLRRYFVLSSTKGEALAPPATTPELGRFQHYTMVAVDGSRADVAFIEPGAVWPSDVAPRSLHEGIARLLNLETAMPEGYKGPETRTALTLTADNTLPEPVTVSLELTGVGPEGWRLAGGGEAPGPLTVAPGEKAAVPLTFATPTAQLLPVPRMRCAALYKGVPVQGFDRNVPLFPESALRWPTEWQVAGPVSAGPLPRAVPPNPREALPRLYAAHGPEQGYKPGAAYTVDGQTFTWQKLSAQPEYGAGFVNLGKLYGVGYEQFAYVYTGVRSPDDRTVYAQFRVDDYGQILVNGTLIENERLYRTRSDATWVGLPLRKGWNSVVVKAVNITGGWSFRLLFADPDHELEFAPEQAPAS